MTQDEQSRIQKIAYKLYRNRVDKSENEINDWLIAERAVRKGFLARPYLWLVFMLKRNSREERVFWAIVCIVVFAFARFLGLDLIFAVVIVVIVGLGCILLDVNKTAVIATAALFFTLATFSLLNKEQNLRNRPYIRTIDKTITFRSKGTFKPTEKGPEPVFDLGLEFINQGPLPGAITEITIRAHPDMALVFSKDAVPFYVDREKRKWGRVTLFPYLNNIDDLKRITRTVTLNINDVKKLFGLEYDADSQKEPAETTVIFKKLGPVSFHFIVQVKYFGLSDVNENSPYWHWSLYHYQEGSLSFLDGGSNKVIEED